MNIIKYHNPIKETKTNTIKMKDGKPEYNLNGEHVYVYKPVFDENNKPVFKDDITIKFEFVQGSDIPKSIGIDLLTQMSVEFKENTGKDLQVCTDDKGNPIKYVLRNYSKEPFTDSTDTLVVNGHYSPVKSSSFKSKLSFK